MTAIWGTKYGTILADPPWQFDDKLPGDGIRGAEKHYNTLCLPDMLQFLNDWNIQIANDSRLFLWRVASMQQEALMVMEEWGFKLKAEIVWKKLTSTGKRHFGMGRTVRMEHEVCLIGQRGKPPVLNHSTRPVFEAKVSHHSKKPYEFYDIIESLSPGPYLEIFARNRRDGWDSIGDEL